MSFEAPIEFGVPGDRDPEEHGVPDILKVTRIFEDAGIPCYWEISVPTEKLDQAVQLLKSEPHDKVYQPWKAEHVQPGALTHTFPRFKLRGISLRFQIVPSNDVHFDISEVDRSPSGLPYPKLEPYVQSLLETERRVDLCDLIDGMNLSEEWGEEHLNIDKTTDVYYAKRKNERILASMLPDEDPFGYPGVPAHPTSLREIWQEAVRGKEQRISKGLPLEFFATRFFAHGAGIPV